MMNEHLALAAAVLGVLAGAARGSAQALPPGIPGEAGGTGAGLAARVVEGRAMAESHRGPVTSIAVSPDGAVVASGGADATFRLWEAKTGKALFVLRGHEGVRWKLSRSSPRAAGSTWVGFAPDGKQVVTAGVDSTLRLWDAATGKELKVVDLKALGWTYAAPAAGFVAEASRQVTLINAQAAGVAWDLAGGEAAVVKRFEGLGMPVFSADGRWVAGLSATAPKILSTVVRTYTLAVREAATGAGAFGPWEIVVRFPRGEIETVRCAWVSPDGASLIEAQARSIGGEVKSLTLRLRSTATGVYTHTWPNAPGPVRAVTADGRGWVLAWPDHTLRLMEPITARQLMSFAGLGGAAGAVAFSRDGAHLAAGSADGAVRIWATAGMADLLDAVQAPVKKDVEALWELLAAAGGDNAKARQAAEGLSYAGDRAVPFVVERLEELRPDVKKLATTLGEANRLLGALNRPAAADRKEAGEKLRSLVAAAMTELDPGPAPALKKLLDQVAPRARYADARGHLGRCLTILQGPTTGDLLAMRGAKLLERIGTDAARKALVQLLRVPNPRLTAEVEAALERMTKSGPPRRGN